MQREAMVLEKEVAAKNNKIYELEMNYLKGGRAGQGAGQRAGGGVQASSYGRSQEERPSRYNNTNKAGRLEAASKSDRNQSSPRTITLAYSSFHSVTSSAARNSPTGRDWSFPRSS
jgi:hypothetical protein